MTEVEPQSSSHVNSPYICWAIPVHNNNSDLIMAYSVTPEHFMKLEAHISVGSETGYPNWGFSWLFLVPPGKYKSGTMNYADTAFYSLFTI
jgi:hypothetical protein